MKRILTLCSRLRATLALVAVVLTIMVIVVAVEDPAYEIYPNDTYDTQIQPHTSAAWGSNCVSHDYPVGYILENNNGTTIDNGEVRRFQDYWGGRPNQYVDIGAWKATSTACNASPFHLTKRVKYAFGAYEAYLSMLKWVYEVYPRSSSCSFQTPDVLRQNGCRTNLLIAWNGCDACGTGYAADGACNCIFTSPIVLNMQHGARFDISSAKDGVQFDLNGDGRKELVAWPTDTANIGFLYLYKGPNGEHNGRNLFGDKSSQKKVEGVEPNGFRALAEWDDNVVGGGNVADGAISSADGITENLLRVWFDLNRDGELQADTELKTLAELDIAKIELKYVVSERQDRSGNKKAIMAKYWKAGDPQPYFAIDYWATTAPIPK